jgi:CHAT domain-containing protein
LRQQYNELNPLPHLTFDQIHTIIDEKTVILEWHIASDTFQTFIITSRNQHSIMVWQSSPKDLEALFKWANGYLRAYYTDKTQWQSELSNRFSRLSEILHLDNILSLVHQACEWCSQLILIPHRFLHLFPLHALSLTNGKCLLDKFDSVRYAPSCQLLQQVQQQQRPNLSDFFAIQNPTNDLPYADLEVEVIRSFFPTDNVLVLAKQAATKTALDNNQNLSITHCTHFACHGEFEFESPLESALKLANGEQLTLADIFGLSLNQCRLVTLSACETGLTDPTSISDEYIGLPSGFLYACCTNVVSSLWKVNDISSTFLMIKFYQNLKKNQNNVAKALNDAQRWLRDATQQQLLDWANQLNLDKDKMTQIEDQLDWYNPDDKPYNDPYHWAAFCAIGQ